MRVSELAKTLKMPSKDLLETLKTLRIAGKTAASTLDADTINRIRKALAQAKKLAAKNAAKAKPAAKRAAAAGKRPVGARLVPPPAPPQKSPAAAPVKGPVVSPAGKTAAALAPPALKAAPAEHLKIAAAPSAPAATKSQAPAAKPQLAAPVKSAAAPAAAPAKAAPAKKVRLEPAPEPPAEPVGPPKQLSLRFPVTVKELALEMDVKPTELIKHLMGEGIFAAMVQLLDEATVTKIAPAFHCEVLPQPTLEDELLQAAQPDPANLKPRAPVVTFMGHVDHGKTSLLDAIRRAKVAEGEAGGITQHIGAYEVALPTGHVTFLDTPGHEAFSALRARGANVTDIVVLVVAANDGVMPQTVEAIDHARAANVPIVVAINKSDLPEANPQKVKQQLAQHQLMAEDWGGKTIMVPVSAKTRQGLDELLEMLLLEAELLELKADQTISASGTVIEAKKTSDRGPVATILVQQGTLRVGDPIVAGAVAGRVRAMTDDRGHRVKDAGPSRPVEVLGLPDVPKAGDQFLVVADEKAARQVAEQRRERAAQQAIVHPRRITLEELHQRITEGKLKELRFILKADVQGSLEAIVTSLQKLDTEKEAVQFRILHTGVGDINESDVILAAASDAIVIGFHVGIDPQVQVLAASEGVDVHIYQIIYELISAIKAAIEGLLEPTLEETFVGRAEVRKLFQVSKIGMVAGCMVTKGSIRRDATFRLIRGKERIFDGKIQNLKRLKDDAREVLEGVECGISLEGNVDLQVGDLIEAWDVKKVARRLA